MSRSTVFPYTSFIRVTLVMVGIASLTGCVAALGGVALSKTLDMIGLEQKKPDAISPDAVQALQQALPKKIPLRLHAGDTLNTDPELRSLSVVVRIYKLRNVNAFLAAPYKSMGSEGSEKEAFGTDLLDVRELVLTPGQKHEVLETMPSEASHLAVVALFRAPAEGRWRFAFRAKESEKTGITIGVHGCAMSAAAGSVEGVPAEMLRVAGVRCR